MQQRQTATSWSIDEIPNALSSPLPILLSTWRVIIGRWKSTDARMKRMIESLIVAGQRATLFPPRGQLLIDLRVFHAWKMFPSIIDDTQLHTAFFTCESLPANRTKRSHGVGDSYTRILKVEAPPLQHKVTSLHGRI